MRNDAPSALEEIMRIVNRCRGWAVLVAAAAALPAAEAAAQVGIGTEAVVPTASPTGAGVRNLSFGTIVPAAGAAVTVDVPAAVEPAGGAVHAGEYRFDVTAAAGVDFTLSLPAQLTAADVQPLPISFAGARYGAYCVRAGGGACTLSSFDPGTGAMVRVCRQTLGNGSCRSNSIYPAGSELAIYIGGLLTIPAGQPPATYAGVVTLTIVAVH
jgi:hypothetical protein